MVMDAASSSGDSNTTNRGCGPRFLQLHVPHARRPGRRPTSTRKPLPSAGKRRPAPVHAAASFRALANSSLLPSSRLAMRRPGLR